METEFKNQRYALTLAKDGRIMQVTYECFANDTMVLVEKIPEEDTYEYRYMDGEYIHDPLPQPVAEPATDEILNAMLGVTV